MLRLQQPFCVSEQTQCRGTAVVCIRPLYKREFCMYGFVCVCMHEATSYVCKQADR